MRKGVICVSAQSKRLLRCCSCICRPFSAALVGRYLDADSPCLRDSSNSIVRVSQPHMCHYMQYKCRDIHD